MSKPRPTASKRDVQQRKREKAQAKVERRAARQVEEPTSASGSFVATEAELIEELARLHRSSEAGQISGDDFEVQRERIRQRIEQIGR